SDRENEIIEVAEFIGIKSFKAKGKRLTNFQVDNIKEIEPVVKDENDQKPPLEEETPEQGVVPPVDDIPFEIDRGESREDENPNQMSLF
ncbi:MAG: hypothetical protein JW798_06095, partial [Prolixibacteraceae bacterium]|nr:hypothetical protein [Prolixibacteraceae bacterium]